MSCKDSGKTDSTKEETKYEEVLKSFNNKETLPNNMHKIVVTEKLPAGGYLYLNVVENSKEYWMAVPGRDVEIGAVYYYDGGMEMVNFESKTLKRTFEKVIFAEGIRSSIKSSDKAKKTNTNKSVASTVHVEKAANGITVGELFENPNAFRNKQVTVRGQVVKVNNGIMNVNFVHLQDGTKGNGQFDVTLTSDDLFKIGDVVTVKGTVVLDKDFGAGYTYDVLIEKAILLED